MPTLILRHFGFLDCTIDFFSDYLVGWLTQYSWNLFLSDACNANVGIRQGSTLSLVLHLLFVFLNLKFKLLT